MQLEKAELNASATCRRVGLFAKHDVVVQRKAIEKGDGSFGWCAMYLYQDLSNITVDPVLVRDPEVAIKL
jgi:hypothetical protein